MEGTKAGALVTFLSKLTSDQILLVPTGQKSVYTRFGQKLVSTKKSQVHQLWYLPSTDNQCSQLAYIQHCQTFSYLAFSRVESRPCACIR